MSDKLGPYELNSIVTGDARELGKGIPDNSVDLIFTDPPYLKEYLYLYEWLAEFSARVLKPEGFLMAYTGGYWKDKVMGPFSQHLEYFYDYTLLTGNESSMLWGKYSQNKIAPLLQTKRQQGYAPDKCPGILCLPRKRQSLSRMGAGWRRSPVLH